MLRWPIYTFPDLPETDCLIRAYIVKLKIHLNKKKVCEAVGHISMHQAPYHTISSSKWLNNERDAIWPNKLSIWCSAISRGPLLEPRSTTLEVTLTKVQSFNTTRPSHVGATESDTAMVDSVVLIKTAGLKLQMDNEEAKLVLIANYYKATVTVPRKWARFISNQFKVTLSGFNQSVCAWWVHWWD